MSVPPNQLKLMYDMKRRPFYLECCEALGISPDEQPRFHHEFLVTAKPSRGREIIHIGSERDIKAAQIAVRKVVRERLAAGAFGSAQVSGQSNVALIYRPGRCLLGFLSGTKVIWKWDENWGKKEI